MKKLIPAYLGYPSFFLSFWRYGIFRITASIYKVSHGIAILFVFLFLLIAIEITVSAVDNIMFQLLMKKKEN
jgi:cytochrome c oxidase cbb3-type subunit 3